MPRRYEQPYEWRQVLVIAPGCGVIVGALTGWQTHHIVGPILAGIGTATSLAIIWAYRIWRQSHGSVTRDRALIRPMILTGLLLVAAFALAIATQSFSLGIVALAAASFWGVLLRRSRR